MIKKRSSSLGKQPDLSLALSFSLSYPSVSKQSMATFHTEKHTFAHFLGCCSSVTSVSPYESGRNCLLTVSAATIVFLICRESFHGTCGQFSVSKPLPADSHFSTAILVLSIVSEFFRSRVLWGGPLDRWDEIVGGSESQLLMESEQQLKRAVPPVERYNDVCRPLWFNPSKHISNHCSFCGGNFSWNRFGIILLNPFSR